MIEFRHYAAGDICALEQPSMALADLTDALSAMIDGAVPDGDAWTAWQNGHALLTGGLYPMWSGRVVAWLAIGKIASGGYCNLGDWPDLVRYVRSRLHTCRARRIEATALAADRRACRFLSWLGFAREGVLRGYGPDGADHAIYARVAP